VVDFNPILLKGHKHMKDPRQIRQALQTIIGLAMIVLPVALASPFDWRAVVSATLGGIMTLLTNPRLVPGLASAMPDSGSSVAPTNLPSSRPGAGGGPALIALLALGLAIPSCHNVTPDQFFGSVVDCAKINPEAAAESAVVMTCLVGVAAQNPAVCLAGLVTDAKFAIDEVACVVAFIAQQNQGKVAAGLYTEEDLRLRSAANNWLASERISIRNSYGAK
jgi:hypothetical protein